MTKIYVMESCQDCTEVKQRYKVRERGNIGIPCFIKEDGEVIIPMKHYEAGAACSLDGTGC